MRDNTSHRWDGSLDSRRDIRGFFSVDLMEAMIGTCCFFVFFFA